MQIIKFYNGLQKKLWHINAQCICEYHTSIVCYESNEKCFTIKFETENGERQAYFDTEEKMLAALYRIESMIQLERNIIDITSYQ